MKRITETRVVPVCVLERAEDALRVAEALRNGGIPIIEITLRTEAAFAALENVRNNFPDMLVGAGTILTPQQVVKAHEAGAMFGVSPCINEAVLEKAGELNLPFVPGVMTPSEIQRCLALKCKLLKFFPAEQAGGAKTLKAFAGPYASTGVRFIPLGGVNAGNAEDYLRLPIVAAIGGSWLVDKSIIAEKNWREITSRAKEIASLVRSIVDQ